jgi:hypothetical protein
MDLIERKPTGIATKAAQNVRTIERSVANHHAVHPSESHAENDIKATT